MRRITIGLALAGALALSHAGPARGQAPTAVGDGPSAGAPTPAGLVPSGVLNPTPDIVPDPTRGPSLAPAGVPGDSHASLALRQNLAYKLRQGRKEPVVPVPPTLEIEVLDPNADPLGNPAVVPTRDATGRTVIDIPPVVLVHRYYYTGDRSFQGPMLPGGPSILVLNHPKTNERLYVEAQMLPGAPRVVYGRTSVEYDYGPQSIVLKFGHHGKPSVVYTQGLPLSEKFRQAASARQARVDEWVERAGVRRAAKAVTEGTHNAMGATADGVRVVGRVVTTPVVQLLRATPLGAPFNTDPARQAGRERADLARDAEQAARKLDADIPTVR